MSIKTPTALPADLFERCRQQNFLDPKGSNAGVFAKAATTLLTNLLAVYTGREFAVDLRATGFSIATSIRSLPDLSERTRIMDSLGGPSLPFHGAPLDTIVNHLTAYGQSAVRFDNRFIGQMHPNNNIPSFLGALAAKFFNENSIVSEVSPVSSLIERQVIGWLAGEFGFRPDYEGVLSVVPVDTGILSSGNITAGGTTANIAALLVARNRAFADAGYDVRSQGFFHEPSEAGNGALRGGVVIGSDQSHYSIPKLCDFAGIGSANFWKVRTHEGIMSGDRDGPSSLQAQLARALREHRRVIAVVAAAGSTEIGAIDNLESIASAIDDFEKTAGYRPHFHVDAAHGGSFILHPAYAPRTGGLLRGIERADSVTVDPHKMLYTQYNAGCVIFRNREHAALLKQDEREAGYLFQGARDQGQYRVEGSLGVDGALQTFASLVAIGKEGYQAIYDHVLSLTRYLRDTLLDDPLFEVINRSPATNVLCFRARDPHLSNDHHNHLNARAQQILCARGNAYISNDMMRSNGSGEMIDVFRAIVMHPYTSRDDIDAAVADVRESIALARSGATEHL